MKIGEHDITLKNIHAYIQGNLRYLAEQYGPDFIRMEPHVREQVMLRTDIAKPECVEKKECTDCHCAIPELFYADKQCGGKCYPEMMNKEEWEEFKKTMRSYTLENNIDKIEYPFNWKHIQALINGDDKKKEEIILGKNTSAISDITVELDDQYIDSVIKHEFKLINHNDVNIFIKDVSTSCGCTTTDSIVHKIIPANSELTIDVKVDTNNKKPGYHTFITELTMNNNTKTKLTIKCKLISK